MNKYLAALLLTLPVVANAHWHDGYYYDTKSLNISNGSNWMKTLDDADSLQTISIPGTHDSAAHYGGPYAETQTLTVAQQLKAGIRFLDIRGRPTNGSLAIHHGQVFQKQMFGQVLNEVILFLHANPSEFIIMRVKEEHSNDRDAFLHAFNKYAVAPHNKPYIWQGKNPGYSTSLGALNVADVRGKIVFVREAFNNRIMDGSIGVYQSFTVEDNWVVKTNWDLYEHWERKKASLATAQRNGRSVLTFISGSDIAFPYFVASGHSSPGTTASRLSTGLTTPGWSWKWKDFPRVNCFIGICTIAFEGVNVLATDYIRNSTAEVERKLGGSPNGFPQAAFRNPRYVGIVVADFPGPGFIEAVIAANNKTSTDGCRSNCMHVKCGAGELSFEISKDGRMPAVFSSRSGGFGPWVKVGPFRNTTYISGVPTNGDYYRNTRANGLIDIYTRSSSQGYSCFGETSYSRINDPTWNYVGTSADGGRSYYFDRADYNGQGFVSGQLATQGSVLPSSVNANDVIIISNGNYIVSGSWGWSAASSGSLGSAAAVSSTVGTVTAAGSVVGVTVGSAAQSSSSIDAVSGTAIMATGAWW